MAQMGAERYIIKEIRGQSAIDTYNFQKCILATVIPTTVSAIVPVYSTQRLAIELVAQTSTLFVFLETSNKKYMK